MHYENKKTKAMAFLFLVLSFGLVIVLDVEVVEAEPNLIVVPDDYFTIHEAINGAAHNHNSNRHNMQKETAKHYIPSILGY